MGKIAVVLLLASALCLAGCGTKEYNDLMLRASADSRAAYARAMVACGDNAACQTGVSAAYFGNAGQLPLKAPDSAIDYARAAFPLLELLVRWDTSGEGTGSGGVVFKNVKFGRDAVISGFNYTKTTSISEANNNRTFSVVPPAGGASVGDNGVTAFPPVGIGVQ